MRKRCNGIIEAIWLEKEDRAKLFVSGRHCKDGTVLTDQHYQLILSMCRELQVHKVFPFNNENDPILDVKVWVSKKLKMDRHRFLRSRNNNAFFEKDGEDSDLISDEE
ncbi:uncharacterized protein [Chelonus insularis]|uniref:uncharacterized protein n=1 Tax=Chelonus insularis TaxID=460826 RepID=UPI00158AC316|nr:uncharacterized protein LOC118064224 [Chelonus insularis]